MRKVFLIVVLLQVRLGMFPTASFAFIPQPWMEKVKGEAGDKLDDADKLGMALEYFSSGKYHECLLLLQQLDKHYRLNPRYRAYLGVCYYYEWNFEQASKVLDEVMPRLSAFAPHERSFYYWADAESHFNLREYQQAIPLYLDMLTLCHDNEKPDAQCRLGFCYMFAGDYVSARTFYRQALDGYLRYRNTPDEQPRIAQIRHMLRGIDDLLHVGIDKREGQ